MSGHEPVPSMNPAESEFPPPDWEPFPARPSLTPNGIEVVGFSLRAGEDSVSGMLETLSPDERARAARFRFDRHRRRYVRGRFVLRRLLAACLGAAPGEIVLEYGKMGKPTLAGPGGWLCFNLSHTGDAALIALTRDRQVGIDIESNTNPRRILDLARRVFTPGEAEQVEKCDMASGCQDLFYRIWAAKEAFVKASGDGLGLSTRSFEIEYAAPSKPGAVFASSQGHRKGQLPWELYEIDAGRGFAAAVVAAARDGEPSPNLRFRAVRSAEWQSPAPG